MKKYLFLFTTCLICSINILKAQTPLTDGLVKMYDSRNVNDLPNFLTQGAQLDFKARNTIGVPGLDEYSVNLTIAPWKDMTGGNVHQLNFNNGGLYYREGSKYFLQWNSWNRLLMENAQGNVGIGTSNPGASLEVYRAVRPTFELRSATAYLQIGIADGPGEYTPWAEKGDVVFRSLDSNHNLNFVLPNDNNDGKSYFKFGDVLNGGWFTIFNNRIVRVDGKMIAKEVVIQSNVWADHVFSPNYQLMPLSEVETYIKQNKHLPEVPTEKEVSANGINLAEMNVILLKKVEELTLHVIELEKKVNALKEEKSVKTAK